VFFGLLFLFYVYFLITNCCGLKQIMKDVTWVLWRLEIRCTFDLDTSSPWRLLGHCWF